MQDAASQFVQLTWLFTTQPELLHARPHRSRCRWRCRAACEPWIYDVLGAETLHTPFGRRADGAPEAAAPSREPGGDLTAEIWFAPTLQYLPVRIRIHQDAQTFVDLTDASAAAAGRHALTRLRRAGACAAIEPENLSRNRP